jgi:predicted ATPase
MPPPRFVLTGGPGAGKTSVLNLLAERGFACVPESARAIIQRRRAAGSSARPAPLEFAQEILRLDIEAHRSAPDDGRPVFFDRSVIETLAMLDAQAPIKDAEMRRYLTTYPYASSVFLFPAWREIYTRDAERDQDFEDAVRVYGEVRSWYQRWGFALVEVPRGSVEARADFIVAHIEAVLAAPG